MPWPLQRLSLGSAGSRLYCPPCPRHGRDRPIGRAPSDTSRRRATSGQLCLHSEPSSFRTPGHTVGPNADGRVSKLQSTFCHHLDEIPEAELITKVPTYAQQDHLTIEVPTRKHCLRSFPITHPSTKLSKITLYPNGELAICT